MTSEYQLNILGNQEKTEYLVTLSRNGSEIFRSKVYDNIADAQLLKDMLKKELVVVDDSEYWQTIKFLLAPH